MNEAAKSMPSRRRSWSHRSEMMRPSDWVQATLLVVVIIAAAVLLPISLAVGSETYANQSRLGEEQRQARYPATATLLQDAPPATYGSHGEVVAGTASVPARWTLADGTERTGKVLAKTGTKTGTPARIWLDGNGNPAGEPITHEQAAFAGIGIAMGVWVCAAAALCALYLLVRFGLNRHRSAAWEREWARVDRDWSHPAGSGT